MHPNNSLYIHAVRDLICDNGMSKFQCHQEELTIHLYGWKVTNIIISVMQQTNCCKMTPHAVCSQSKGLTMLTPIMTIINSKSFIYIMALKMFIEGVAYYFLSV